MKPKIVLYMAISANGYIAKTNDETPWADTEWEHFSQFVRARKNIVIGWRTYEIMLKANSFEVFGPIDIVVISQSSSCGTEVNCVHSPEEAIKVLTEKGHSEIVIAGGSTINGLFVEIGMIDEVRLDVEPILFERGLPLFSTIAPVTLSLTLQTMEKVGEHGVHLCYRVQR